MENNGLSANGCPWMEPAVNKISLQEIERSIIKRYRKQLWSKFVKAIQQYRLIADGDKIAVAISGGKDSLLMAKLFQELKRNGRDNFDLEFIAMDPGYHPSIKELLLENCDYLKIPVLVFHSNIFEVADRIAGEYPCYMCARMRRGALYAKAQELGCNKLALGHHFNDVIETTMLNVLCAGNFKTMMPKLKAKNFPGMEIIRPLYLIEEKAIIRWLYSTGLMPLNCACMVAAKKIGSSRHKIKGLIETLNQEFQHADLSIFKAAENVNLDMVLGYEKNGRKISFLDEYEDKS